MYIRKQIILFENQTQVHKNAAANIEVYMCTYVCMYKTLTASLLLSSALWPNAISKVYHNCFHENFRRMKAQIKMGAAKGNKNLEKIFMSKVECKLQATEWVLIKSLSASKESKSNKTHNNKYTNIKNVRRK